MQLVFVLPPCLPRNVLTFWQHRMSSPPAGAVKSTCVGPEVPPKSTPPRSHPWIAMTLIGQIRRHSGWVYSVALSPDASLIASCSNDRTVRIFQAASVASDSDSCASVVLNGHSHAVRCCAFNSSGSRLATASWDGDVRIWDVVSGDCVLAISAAAGGNRVYSCAWAASDIGRSEVLATAGGGGACLADFSVRIWDIVGNEDASAALSCRVFQGHSKAVTCLAFDADGLRLLSSSDDHTVRRSTFISSSSESCPSACSETSPTLRCVSGTLPPAAALSSCHTRTPCAAVAGGQESLAIHCLITAAAEPLQAATRTLSLLFGTQIQVPPALHSFLCMRAANFLSVVHQACHSSGSTLARLLCSVLCTYLRALCLQLGAVMAA